MTTLTLYHGSDHIIKYPSPKLGRADNDFGSGFYCTEWPELAKEWACPDSGRDGFANAYSLNISGLKILNLSDEKYNVLNWLALLLDNRRFSISAPIAHAARQFLLEKYLVDISPYDVVIGYRADDSYFSFAKDFINNTISVQQLSRAMHLGKLGEQIVLKSEKAFSSLLFLEEKSEFADSRIYSPLRALRDRNARNHYLNIERQTPVTDALFIREIMQRNITNDEFKSII